ncbi:Matrilin-4 [Branchiostoma belcheri]|nr:Matrilin-4 [Branchiostoma belcheri]
MEKCNSISDIDECSRPDLNVCSGVARCVNTLASYYCTCPEQYDLIRGRQFKSGYECMYPQRADCDHECVKRPGQGPDSCMCHEGYKLVNGKDCVDINECNVTSTSPCGENSRCVNTRGSFRCECSTSFNINDIDNMACTENNGHWGSWGQYHVCQKHCDYSAMTRRRHCNNPAPSFNGAPCRGSGTQTVLCAKSNCEVDWDADEKSVHVTFESMSALEWVQKEEEFRRLVVNAVNQYCEKAWNFAACCPTTPNGTSPGSGQLVSGSQVKFVPGFPMVFEEELELAVVVTPLKVNDLCSSWDESPQHHNVRPVPTFTHLDQDVLRAALSAHQESYDHEGMEGVMGSRVVKMTLGTGLLPDEPYPAGWMIGVIVVLSILGVGLVIGIVVAIMKHAIPNSLPYSNEWDIDSTSTSETDIGEAWPNPNVVGSSDT